MRFGHAWAGRLLILALIVLLAVFVMRALAGTRRVMTVVAPAVACILAGVGWYTGLLLPFTTIAFDQFAADTQGTGFVQMLGDHVKTVVVGADRVLPNDVSFYLAVHLLVVPGLMIAMLLLGRFLSHRPTDGK